MSLFTKLRSVLPWRRDPSAQRRRTRLPIAEASVTGYYSALGYRSARVGRREGNGGGIPLAGAAHERAAISRENLINQSREFYRDNDLYAALIRRLTRYIVGRGFKLQCHTADPAWNADTEKRFREWFRAPDVTKKVSGRRFARLVMAEVLICGDTSVALTTEGLQGFEAEQMIAPPGQSSWHDGVDRNPQTSAPTGFWIAPYGQGGNVDKSKARRFTPDTLLWILDPERWSSSRGLPYAQASFPMLWRIMDYFDSEAISAQVQARVALAITRVNKGLGGVDQDAELDEQDGDDDDLVKKYATVLPFASIFHAEHGDKIEGVARTAPGGKFVEGLKAFLRVFSAVTGMPLEFLLFDFSDLNYSQFRGAVEVFEGVCEDFQELLEELFYRPAFGWWLQREVAEGRIVEREDQLEHGWLKDKFPWVDRLKESQASTEQVATGQATHASILKSTNQDRPEVVQQLVHETISAIEAAEKVKEETGVEVPWERFAGLKPPAITVKAADLGATQPGAGAGAPAPGSAPDGAEEGAETDEEDAAEDPADEGDEGGDK